MYGDVSYLGLNVWGHIVSVPDTVGVQGGDMVGRGND
jgi:hypothetical protein